MQIISAPTVVVHVNLDQFTFTKNTVSQLDTCIHIKIETNGHMTILDFGNRLACTDQPTCVDLFRNQGYIHKNVNRFDLFELWFQHGLSISLTKSPSIFRPIIKYENYTSLNVIFLGFEKVILEQVALQSGCRKVVFE